MTNGKFILEAIVVAMGTSTIIAPASADGLIAGVLRDTGIINEQQRKALDDAHTAFGKPLDQVANQARAVLLGNFCNTPAGRFGPGPVNPVGSGCNVMTATGLIFGQVSR